MSTLAEIQKMFNDGVGSEYGLALSFPASTSKFTAVTNADYAQVLSKVTMVTREMRRYPVKMIQGSRLEHFYIVTKAPFAGLASSSYFYLSGGTSVRVFHHEMFHVFDRSYAPWRPTSPQPVEWVNPRAFTYGSPNPWPDLKCFASRYAMTNENEDQAETAAYIWTNGNKLHERIKTDHWLRRKVKNVIDFYSSHGLTDFDYLTTSWWKRQPEGTVWTPRR